MENTSISIATEGITMSTKLMNQGEKSKRTASPDEKSVSMSESWQPQEQSVQPNPQDGKKTTPVMTEAEISDLLARLQDVLSLWAGSDNQIIGGYVMTAFPIPPSMKVARVRKIGGHDKVFTVNNVPVVSIER